MYRSRVAFDTSSLCRSERRKRGKSFDKVSEERLGREILSRRIYPSARCRYAAFGTVHRVPVVHALPIRSSSSSSLTVQQPVDVYESPRMIERRRRKTDRCDFRHSFVVRDFRCSRRLNVSRCGNRIIIAPLTRSRSKGNTDRSPVTRIGKSSRIRRAGHPIDMETDIGVASWSLLDGRPPYSENSRIGKGPYRRFFIDISKIHKSRKLEFRSSSAIFRDDERTLEIDAAFATFLRR